MDVIDTPLGTFQLLEKTGFGRWSEIHRVVEADSGQILALKIFTQYATNPASCAAALRREANAAHQLAGCHPHNDYMFCVALDVTTVYYQGSAVPALLLPFCDGITMADWLQMQPPLSSRIVVLHKLLHALAGLHDTGLAHNDLSLGNVMIGADTITLIDFDRAQPTDVHQADHPAARIGAFYDERCIGQAADLRAFSILICIVLGNAHPFTDDLLGLLQGRETRSDLLSRTPTIPHLPFATSEQTEVIDAWLTPLLRMQRPALTRSLLSSWPFRDFMSTPASSLLSPPQ